MIFQHDVCDLWLRKPKCKDSEMKKPQGTCFWQIWKSCSPHWISCISGQPMCYSGKIFLYVHVELFSTLTLTATKPEELQGKSVQKSYWRSNTKSVHLAFKLPILMLAFSNESWIVPGNLTPGCISYGIDFSIQDHSRFIALVWPSTPPLRYPS